MTRAAWLIAWHEYFTNVRRPAFLIATFVAPLGVFLVMALIFALAAPAMESWVSAGNPQVGVVDPTGRLVPIPDAFSSTYVAFDNEGAARAAMESGALSGYVVVDRTFPATGRVAAWTRPDVNVQLDGLSASRLRPLLLGGLLAGSVDEATLALVQSPDFGEVEATVLGGAFRDDRLSTQLGRAIVPFFVAMLLAMTTFGASNYLLRSVTEEKENRVLEVLLCAVTPMDLLAGKVLGLGALSVTQVAVWPAYGVLPLAVGVGSITGSLTAVLDPVLTLLSLGYFALGYLQYAVLLAAAGALGTSMRESQQIGAQFALFSMIPLFLAPLLILDPQLAVARVLSFVPLFAPMMMMIRLPFGGVPMFDIGLSLVVSAISVPLIVWGAARVFRASLLVYGKRLTVREILAALRHD